MKKILIFIPIIILISSAYALETPKLEKYVNDYAGILDSNCEYQLNSMIKAIEDNTTDEIAILTIQSLQGEDLEDFSLRTFRENGIGKKDKNNGLLILVAMQERQWRFETGYGLEGQLPDTLLYRFGEEELKPELKTGNYCEGFNKTINKLSKMLVGNETSGMATTTFTDLIDSVPWILILFALIPFFIGLIMESPVGRGDSYSMSDSDGDYEVKHRERCPRCGGIMKKDRVEKGYIIYKCRKCKTEKKRKATKDDEGKVIPLIIAGGSSGGHSGGSGGSSGGSSGGFGGGFGGGGGASGGFIFRPKKDPTRCQYYSQECSYISKRTAG